MAGFLRAPASVIRPSPVLRSSMLLSTNVMIKLIDHEFLFVNNAFYKISNRDDAGYFSAFGDRQMYK